jgi:hypothetical protein
LSSGTIIFLVAALLTATVTLLIVSRLAQQLKHVTPTGRKVSIFLDLPWIIREHYRLFPQSGPMLAFWLSIIFLLVWLTCLVFNLAEHLWKH